MVVALAVSQGDALYEAEQRQLSMALAGDCLLTRRLSVYREDRFMALRRLLRSCDVGFVNLETAIHRYQDGYQAQHDGGGTYMTTEPELVDDLQWLGLNLVASGSSHADDYGVSGIVDTIRFLDAAGVAHAGSGRHLAEARAPGYLETRRGRIGLVAATFHFNPGARAGEQRHDTVGHPGVNAIRSRWEYVVPEAVLQDVRRIGAQIGCDAARARRAFQGDPLPPSEDDAYEFLGHTFRRGEETTARLRAYEHDVAATLGSVELARAMSDFVIVSVHCHELGGAQLLTATRRSAIEEPSEAVSELAHRAIDAGADVFVGHGPQVPLGVEIYRGRPIFHGLGTFIFQPETVRYLPAEAYDRYGLDGDATPLDFLRARYADDTRGHTGDPAQWRQIVATCEFRADELAAVNLHPLTLGFGKPTAQRGRPLLDDREPGATIIERIAQLSRRYGTRIENKDGVGVLALA